MVRRFVRELKKGDGVITYDPDRRIYLLGEIESDVETRDHALGRLRRVRWTHEVQRDVLSPTTRNTLGAIATLFQVVGDARDEVWTKAAPVGTTKTETLLIPSPAAASGDAEATVLADTLAKAESFVEDRLVKLAWDDVQELVAGILRAMGSGSFAFAASHSSSRLSPSCLRSTSTTNTPERRPVATPTLYKPSISAQNQPLMMLGSQVAALQPPIGTGCFPFELHSPRFGQVQRTSFSDAVTL
jgi:hypothetical protein